jgi:predicted PurR-regulated permease PerM
MLRLASILYSIVATTLSGSLIIIALSTGYDTLTPILVAAVIGAILAIPVSYFVAQAIISNKR